MKKLFIAVLLLVCACKGYDSYEYLNGEFIGSTGQNPATLISPVDEGTVVITKQFSWSKQDGAKSYKIEFSLSTDFSAPVLRATVATTNYTISSADLVGVTSLALKTYYWRVTTTYATKAEISATFKFNLMDPNIVYVDGNSTATGQVGNQAIPFKILQQAIDFAATSGRSKVYVAAATYSESVTLREGVSLYGGYESTNWNRDVPTYQTRIFTPSDFITVYSPTGITSATVLDGFLLHNVTSSADSTALFIYLSSPTVSNNRIGGQAAGAYSVYGIQIRGGSPIVVNNMITGGNSSTKNYGIHIINSGVKIINNTINGGDAGTSYGISVGTGSPEIINNIIFVTGGTTKYCVYEDTGSADPSAFQNNNLFGCTGGLPNAFYFDEGTTGMINTCGPGGTGNSDSFHAGSAGIPCASSVNNGASPVNGNISVNDAGPLLMSIAGADTKAFVISDNDWHLNNASAANCKVRGGGLNLVSTYPIFTTDKDGVTRTATSLGCASPNTGAAGWSMGAYESN